MTFRKTSKTQKSCDRKDVFLILYFFFCSLLFNDRLRDQISFIASKNVILLLLLQINVQQFFFFRNYYFHFKIQNQKLMFAGTHSLRIKYR